MGWTVGAREKGKSNLDFFTEEGLFNDTTHKVLDSSTVGGTFYAALQTESGKVVAVVVATKRWRTAAGYVNEFGWKGMDEFMGPNESRCPDRILDQLSPLGEPDGYGQTWAAEWRARCRKHNEIGRLVRKGVTIKLAEPIKFTDGVERETLTYQGRGNQFTDQLGRRVGLSGWRERAFEVVS